MTRPWMMPAIVATLLSALACSRDSARTGQDSPPPPQASARSFLVGADTLWRRGGPAEDSLFREPVQLGAGFGRVYLADSRLGVLAFDAAGAQLWRTPGEEGGPAGVGQTRAFVVDSPASPLVLDRTGRLVRLDSAGRVAHAAYISGARSPSSLCRLSDRALLETDFDDGYKELERSGQLRDTPEYPFPALADSSHLLKALTLASAPDADGCIIAQLVGNEFAIRDVFGVRRVPYVEQIVLPPVQLTIDSFPGGSRREEKLLSPIHTAERVATTKQLIAISFGGASPRRDGIIDLYDRAAGRYLGTVRIGTPVDAVALAGDTLYVAHLVSGVPALTALRLPPLS